MDKQDRSYRRFVHIEDLLLYAISISLLIFFSYYFVSVQTKNDTTVYSKLDEKMYENLRLNDTTDGVNQEFLKAQLQLVYKRYEFQTKVSRTLAYIKFMGFLVGTVLILFGSIIVVRGVRDHGVSLRTENSPTPFKLSVATSSPGIFLAFIGAIIIVITMLKGLDASVSDEGIVLPVSMSRDTLQPQASSEGQILKIKPVKR